VEKCGGFSAFSYGRIKGYIRVIAYIGRRLLLLPLVIFGVTLIIFLFMEMIDPYKRLSLYVNENVLDKIKIEDFPRLLHKYGLDRPFHERYAEWITNLFHGNLGYSVTGQMSVREALVKYFPASAELALFAIFPIVFFSVRMGVFAAVRRNSIWDHGTRVLAITGWSLPTYVAGLLILMLFYGTTGWFSPGRLSTWTLPIVQSSKFVHYTGMNTIDALLNGNGAVFADALRHLIMPVVTLSCLSWALILRVTRSSMLETLRQDYITSARAKGLKERVVVQKHAKRNAMIPVVTLAGLMVAGLLNGVVVTEVIFNYPGLGRFAARAALGFDAAGVLGFAMFNAALLVITNLVVDVLYAMINPRVRLA
jgi:ABC-type dipeptide/oligopeptide/nickel transport system permease component